ncbi:switch 2 isoform X2 [Prunus avium]|uniref:Switch 2 isoform X2 n=1 Tax=Prunus avium TaxID=42229 RepID=A0A6P5TJ85_PRUAV|nr:switch 2 isoform X2 [Prunus avium]
MSLHSFKEALKPCRNSSSLTSSAIQSQSSLSQTLEDPTIPRKPPKSSLSQQLLRLQDPLSLPPIPPQSQPKPNHDLNGKEDENDEKDDDPESLDYEKPKVGLFEFDRIGPYEPLVLSSEGEFPVIQVPASINCRLLEHQREGVKFLYNLYKNNHGGILGDDMICGSQLSEVNWEIVIVDEAHRLKNEKSKLYIACLEFKTLKRIGLTGTVMQNKIMELFNLFDWVAPGALGTREHFREFYDEPLKHGQRSTAPERFVRVADERKQHLVGLLHKYMLRRTKEETIGHLMMGKEDNVIFCAMSELQKRVYRRMLQLPDIQCLINKDLPCSCGSPLAQAECCKRTVPDGKIWPYLHKENPDGCDSCPFCIVLPCLIKLQQISNHLELIKPNPKDDPDKQKKDAEFASAVFGTDINLVGGNTQNESFMGLSDVKHCGKMRALEKFLFSWISHGDKVLLFSYSVRMLDILEKFLIRKGYCFSRLDGSTPTNLRLSIVDDFNSSPSKQVFLISTRAGGLGLNLVSANRVVIFDPSWNPAQDLQAQDRSFRFGQKRHVVVFRFLSAGSLDELVYSRQVYKQQLSNIAVSGKMEKRYFEGVQDCKEFQGELFGICNLFRDLSDKVFTSEIFELHEKDGQKEGYGIRQQSTDVGSNSVSLKEVGVTSLSLSETRTTSNSKKGLTSQPVLKDVGVVYAHRNEDIVNYGPGGQGATEMIPQNNGIMDPYIRVARRKRLDGIVGKENFPSRKDQKRIQYSLISIFMGLGELEFSKWVISATPMERETVLRDFKKRKEKIHDG